MSTALAVAVAIVGVSGAALVGTMAWRAGSLLAMSLLLVVLEVDVSPVFGDTADTVRDVVVAFALLGAAAIGWWRLGADRKVVFATPMVYLLALLGSGLALAPLSIAPLASAQRSAGAAALVVVVLVTVHHRGFVDVLEALLIGLIILVVASAVWELSGAGTPVLDWRGEVDTGVAGLARASGLSGDPNALGRAAALCAVGGASLLGRGRGWLPVTAEVVGLGGLFLAQSRTALVVALVMLTVIHLRLGHRRLVALGVSVGLVISAVIVSAGTSTVDLVSRQNGGTQELATVTGRTGLWEVVWVLVWDHPIEGFGAFAASEALADAVEFRWVPFDAADAHNLALDLFLTRGLIGVALLVALVGSIVSHRPSRLPWPDPGMMLLVTVVLLSITENTLRKPAAPLMVAAAVITALTVRPTQPSAAEGPPRTERIRSP